MAAPSAVYTSPFAYKHNVVNGGFVPPFFSQESYDTALMNHPLKDGDVIISTYPKSGTTLTQQLVYQLRHGPVPEGVGLQSVCPWHETSGKSEYPNMPQEKRTWKSHLNWPDTFKPEANVKYIYVARNGKDVAVSLFHHARGFLLFDYTGDWNDWFERCMSGQIEFGLWQKHVLGWWEASKEREDILFVFYEDFVKDQETFVKKVADFIGEEMNDEVMERVCKATAFKTMKESKQTNYSAGRREGLAPFMRKGKVGDWQTLFTEEQSKRWDAMFSSEIDQVSDLSFSFE